MADAEGFDFVHAPTPQQPAFFAWLKRQLVNNATVVWMIMWDGQAYPACASLRRDPSTSRLRA